MKWLLFLLLLAFGVLSFVGWSLAWAVVTDLVKGGGK